MDLSKAFDTLNHSILLDKLNYYGIKKCSLQLIKSYLANRSQYVEHNGIKSDYSPISTGVPQGSILGPLLFIIYLSDIPLCSKIFKFIIYADDTTLFSNLSEFKKENRDEMLNAELSKINMWFQLNKLSLNTTKSKFMVFRKPQKKIKIPVIKINQKELEYVETFNFLGVNLDTNISWKSHLSKVSNKIVRMIGIMNKLQFILPQNTLSYIYNSLIMPHINYCIILWGHANKRIFKLQKKAVRIIYKEHRLSRTDPIFKNLNLLKIDDIYRLQLLKLYFKCKQNLLPVYFDSFDLTPNYRVHHHNTRNINKIHEPYVRHDFAKTCSRYELPILVNKTSPSIIEKVNTHSFKGFCTYTKKYFIDNYSTTCDILNCYSCNSIPNQ